MKLFAIKESNSSNSFKTFPNLWQVNRIDKIIVALLLIEITLHFAEVVIDMMQLLKLV